MLPAIILLVSDENDSDENFSKFLEFLGIPYVYASTREVLMHHVEDGIKCLAASSHTINKYKDIEHELYDKLSYVLLYEAESTQSPVSSSVVITNHKDICRELAGLSFIPANEFIFTLNGSTQDIQELISINNKAFFAFKHKGQLQDISITS
jgi:hypothetical protein